MNRLYSLLFVFALATQQCYGQTTNILLDSTGFMGIRLGQTDFTSAREMLQAYAYKEPKLIFRSIRWRDGGCSTLYIHRHFLKLGNSKVELTLWGYGTVDRIRIHCSGNCALKYGQLTIGRTKVGELEYASDRWEEIVDSNAQRYVTNVYSGARVDIPGDSVDVQKANWANRRIKTITLTK